MTLLQSMAYAVTFLCLVEISERVTTFYR